MNPENDDGNVEYKRHIIKKDDKRLEELSTQMKFRVNEGDGEAIYHIGVEDNGDISGVNDEQYRESLKNLQQICDRNNFCLTQISSKKINKTHTSYQFLIRQVENPKYIEVKICIAGNVDSGKSTLLGVLTNDKLDDGRGSLRLAVFNHKHEVNSGRTSSIAHHIMGFNEKGENINYKSSINNVAWPNIVKKSKKLISFYDLAGHEKYLKTTIRGLSSITPDYCFILVGANMGVSKMTREHVFICLTLNIPFSIIITKLDICKDRKNILDTTISQIKKLLKLPAVKRMSYSVSNTEEAITAAKNFKTENIVPVFKVSNVTGKNINLVKTFLNVLKPINQVKNDNKNVLLSIDGIFNVTGVGIVVAGDLISGKIYTNDKLYVGPDYSGKYYPVTVRSIHIKRVPVLSATSGTYICLALKKISRKMLRIGQVVVSTQEDCKSQIEFCANISVIKSNTTTIKIGYEPTVHTCNVRQTAKITKIETDKEILTTGDNAKVTFKFCNRPEYIQPGNKIIFCEGKIKAIGSII